MEKNTKRLRTVFFGTPELVIPIIEFLNKKTDLVLAVTAPDTPQGRQQELKPTPVKRFCLENNVKVLTPVNFNEDILDVLKDLKADIFIVAAYGKILPNELLEIPKFGSFNIHPSLLPKYRGASPVQNAILNKDKETGVTIIKMDEKMDHGPIISQIRLDISDNDNYETLGKKLFEISVSLLDGIFDKFFNEGITETEQKHDEATFTKIIKKDDGYFDINNPPKNLKNIIRAFYPWPTAWTKWQERIVKFLPDEMIQMEGKKPVSKRDFLNGYPDFPLKDF